MDYSRFRVPVGIGLSESRSEHCSGFTVESWTGTTSVSRTPPSNAPSDPRDTGRGTLTPYTPHRVTAHTESRHTQSHGTHLGGVIESEAVPEATLSLCEDRLMDVAVCSLTSHHQTRGGKGFQVDPSSHLQGTHS